MADPDIRYYAFKLFPPRPSFPADITAEEAEIMAEHVAYWTACSTPASSSRSAPWPTRRRRGGWPSSKPAPTPTSTGYENTTR